MSLTRKHAEGTIASIRRSCVNLTGQASRGVISYEQAYETSLRILDSALDFSEFLTNEIFTATEDNKSATIKKPGSALEHLLNSQNKEGRPQVGLRLYFNESFFAVDTLTADQALTVGRALQPALIRYSTFTAKRIHAKKQHYSWDPYELDVGIRQILKALKEDLENNFKLKTVYFEET